MAYVADPFGMVNSPCLFVRRAGPNRGSGESRPNAGGRWDRLEDAVEVKLAKGKPSEEIAGQLAGREQYVACATLVGRHVDANPGVADQIAYLTQFAYKRAGGKFSYGAASTVSYYPRRVEPFAKSAPERPQIPGLDGLPVDYPRPIKHKNAGYLVTREVTRVNTQPPSEPVEKFPTPKKSGASVAGKVRTESPWEITTLSVAAQRRYDRSRAPMVFSANGKWLFLVDGKDVLRKIRASDLVEEKSLELGAECDEMSISSAGVVLALPTPGAVWVVDPNSLMVRRAIPMPGVRLVAGSPAVPIGFAVDRAAAPIGSAVHRAAKQAGGPSGGEEITMIDFKKGRLLHRLRSTYDNFPLVIENQNIFGDRLLAIRMSDDGKYFFTGGRKIMRFRLEGEDLVYEESSRDLQNGHTTHFVVSADAKLAAMPTGAGNANGLSYGTAVLDALHLGDQKVALENGAYPCAIGFDTKTGNIYSPNHDGMNIFNARGEKPLHIKNVGRDPHRIAVHPEGGCFALWSENAVTYWRESTAK